MQHDATIATWPTRVCWISQQILRCEVELDPSTLNTERSCTPIARLVFLSGGALHGRKAAFIKVVMPVKRRIDNCRVPGGCTTTSVTLLLTRSRSVACTVHIYHIPLLNCRQNLLYLPVLVRNLLHVSLALGKSYRLQCLPHTSPKNLLPLKLICNHLDRDCTWEGGRKPTCANFVNESSEFCWPRQCLRVCVNWRRHGEKFIFLETWADRPFLQKLGTQVKACCACLQQKREAT